MSAVTEPHDSELFLEEWELEPEPLDGSTNPPWRRRLLWIVAAVTAVALALVPLSNLLQGGEPTVADNGLEVCGFDYCIVQDGVRAAGMDLAMARLANVYLDDEEAEQLVNVLVARLGAAPVDLEVVDRLDRQIEGQYDPVSRTIFIERPARAWITAASV